MESCLIVEDSSDTAAWLERVVVDEFLGTRVDRAPDLASARSLAESTAYSMALVDLGLPDGDGVELIPVLAARGTLCIVTTVFDDDAHLFSALRAGAKGYLLKTEGEDEVRFLLNGITNGRPPLSPAIAQRLLAFFGTEHEDPTEQQNEELTPRELEVLTLIAKGYTTRKAAEMLGITRNTTAGYVKTIYRKLEVSNRAEVALAATQRGLVVP